MQFLPDGLKALAASPQFVHYRLVPKPSGKVDKIPSSPEGYDIDPHMPNNWLSFDQAAAQMSLAVDGVGFVFTTNDPFFCVDIDGCGNGGEWSPLAHELCQQFAGAAVEISQSGTGLHIIGRGMSPPHGKKNKELNLEFYTEARFIALTGNGVTGDASTDHTVALSQFVPSYMPQKAGADATADDWTSTPVEDWCGPEDDGELIKKMLASGGNKAAFGNKATFADLWNANADRLAFTYPDREGLNPYGLSEADAALASHLAFWTGNDCERIARLMRMSALHREKWDDRADYLPRTILGATARCDTAYSNKPAEPKKEDVIRDPDAEGFQFLTVDNQVEYFEGCIYITDLHQVYTPWGDLLRPDRFKARFGGFEFALDHSNQKTTRNAFDAFTESQGHRFTKVDGEAFKPLLPSGELIEHDGRSFVNTYYDIKTPRLAGDPSPFLNHLALVLPDPNDQAILLAYMAACIQYKGIKFDWCPLIQGVEGNGKTLFTRCVKFGIGNRYTHMPKAAKIDSEFNAWLQKAIFVGVEDIYVPGHRQDVINTLKPMITGGDGIEIQKKGVDQVTHEVCANFILNCNPKNGMPKTENDRRFAVFFTAQQSKDDLAKAGMQEGGDYFSLLYDWLNDKGYSIVNEFLHTYQIPDELNPATSCRRAPITSSTYEAIQESRGGVEQEIEEAAGEGRAGFAGGWVSSVALDLLLSQIGASRRIPLQQRWSMLETLGYIPHPNLPSGRTNNSTATDSRKTRLFVTKGHLALNLTSAAIIAKAYDDAQTPEQFNTLAERAFSNE